MDITSVKIVADSSSDILELTKVPFESAPLKIITAQKEYVDDANLDVQEMVDDLQKYKGKSSTSCPNTSDWLNSFGDAKYVFCVTITATLSGSYNAAMAAKSRYEEKYPDRRVFVFNSLTAGPEIALIIEKIEELIVDGKDFDEICDQITKYSKKTGLLFMLESLKNLANNGRVSPLVAKMAGLLGIRLVGKASDKGDLEPLNKCRGEIKALETIVQHLKSLGLSKGKVKIAHCFNEIAGKTLKEMIQKEFEKVQIELYKCRGLCGFYAEKGGLLVGFEMA
ncbi:MAG: DegV family protein [Clostridia bacterium]|nr:DegV family protein [Clostridia bacterium]